MWPLPFAGSRGGLWLYSFTYLQKGSGNERFLEGAGGLSLSLCGLVPCSVSAQVDQTHEWVRPYPEMGGAGDDAARGVAVWYDGTVMTAVEEWNATGSQRETRVYFTDPDNNDQIQASFFGPGSLGNNVWPNDLAAANVRTEALLGGTGIPHRRLAYATGGFTTVGNDEITFVGPVWGQIYNLWGCLGCTGLKSAGGVDAWVAKLDRDPQFSSADWVAWFSSQGNVEGLTIATAPPGKQSEAAQEWEPFQGEFVAVGGRFADETTFDGEWEVAVTGSSEGDAFLALLYPGHGALAVPDSNGTNSVLHLSSSGEDAVTGVAVTDDPERFIFVTGYYSGPDIDFDPDPNVTVNPASGAYKGGKDLFVAKYAPEQHGSLGFRFRLVWFAVTGTVHDDSGEGVAVGSDGSAYVAGWTGDDQGGGDIWIGKVPPNVQMSPSWTIFAWSHSYPGTGDDKALDVAMDGIDRVLFTGHFGNPLEPDDDYEMDADPETPVFNLTSQGRRDVFVARFNSITGSFDWAYGLGNDWDDVGTAIAVDQTNTARMAHAGYFGDGSSAGYTVNFNPAGTPAANAVGKGDADAFSNVLSPTVPDDVTAQLTLVLHRSPDEGNLGEYQALKDALYPVLASSANVPQNGSVAINVIVYPAWPYYWPDPATPVNAVQLVPWTVIDSADTAALVARRVWHLPEPIYSGDDSMSDGIDHALEMLPSYGADYRSLLVVAGQENESGTTAVEASRDAAVVSGQYDQINGLGVRVPPIVSPPVPGGPDRQYMFDHVAKSIEAILTPLPPSEIDLSFSGETDANAYFDVDLVYRLERFIRRACHCPADYTGEGVTNEDDKIILAMDSSEMVFYSDWNMDGVYEYHLPTVNDDNRKFDSAHLIFENCTQP